MADFIRIERGLQYPVMLAENDLLIPELPEDFEHVDIVKARFSLEFTSTCQLQPADFLGIGKGLRLAERQSFDAQDVDHGREWGALFQPTVSDDPVARRKFQKPAPAFVMTMPLMQQETFSEGDRLDLEVLFIGTGVPLIHDFLRSLVHLGHLGLSGGKGCFEVFEVHSKEPGGGEGLVWRQNEPLESLACSVQSLAWMLQEGRVTGKVTLKYITPTRLMVDGKPLRKPYFTQIFPFMLRRVTSMLYAHCGVEVLSDPAGMLADVQSLTEIASRLHWHDWHALQGRQGITLGGFMGDISLSGEALKRVYWVLAVASLIGVGKGATYGSGRFVLSL